MNELKENQVIKLFVDDWLVNSENSIHYSGYMKNKEKEWKILKKEINCS